MKLVFSTAICVYGFSLGASPIVFEEVKERIAFYQKELQHVSSNQEKSRLYYELCLAHLKDQELDAAFRYFLASLELQPIVEVTPALSKEEEKLFTEALDIYFFHSSDPYQNAQEILQRYEKSAEGHAEYYHLNFLIATAYGNQGDYGRFFERIRRYYPFLSQSFLAHKTKGILNLRLSQNATTPQDKCGFKEKALEHLQLALEKNPQDASLYKILIFLAKDEKNELSVLAHMQKMIANNVRIPRSDIYLYVREAVALGECALGQQILDRAKTLYDYSRAISAAQEFLNQHR